MGHQKLHLVGQDTPVAQDEVFPQAWYIGCIQQRHVGLLRRAVALAMVAWPAGGDHVHPAVDAVLGKRDDVLAGQALFMEQAATVGADVAVAREQLGVGQAGLEAERVDVGNTLGADDAVDGDHRLLAGARIVAAAKYRHFAARLPSHFSGGVMNDRLLERNPGLRKPLG